MRSRNVSRKKVAVECTVCHREAVPIELTCSQRKCHSSRFCSYLCLVTHLKTHIDEQNRELENYRNCRCTRSGYKLCPVHKHEGIL